MDTGKFKLLTKSRYKLLPLVLEQSRDMGNSFNEIVKTHLLTELFLDELISLALPEAIDALKSLGLTYKKKLDFASKLYLTNDFPLIDTDTVGSLRRLNSFRNDFAHKLGHKITDEEIKSLYIRDLKTLEDIYGGEITELGQETAISRYLFYIFGCMFPKYMFENA